MVGCAGMGINPANLKGNHARGNFVNRTFMAAWADYQRYAMLENLTPDAKTLLKQKRVILAEFVNPLYGPVIMFNRTIETGVLLDDAAWNAMLDKLVELETGWYINGEMYDGKAAPQTQNLDPKLVFKNEQATDADLNKLIQIESVKAGIRKDTGTEAQALWEGLLIELIRTGIHALRAMLSQRGMDEAQLETAWVESWGVVKALNINDLAVIQ